MNNPTHTGAVTVDERGSGHPFLLLHGGAGPQSVLPFAELLAATRPAHVLTPTIPGFDATPRIGLSSVADLARTWFDELEARDLDDVTVVGSSIGGWTAVEMLLDPRAAARISSAVLIDPVGVLVPEHPITDISAMPIGQVADHSFHDPDRFRIDPAHLPAERRAVMAGNAAASAHYAGDPYMHDPALASRLGGITIPVHLIWGASDRVVTPDYGRAFTAWIPNAEMTLLDASGHFPQIEEPERSRDLVWDTADRHARHRPS